jgi:3-(3-hydroxy-phenyl)propionate hydroxylase
MIGFDYDVAIIGYGPTGVIAANYLGKFGIKTVVVERDRDVYSRARAVTVDGTTMRTFQALGLADEAKADMNITTALRWKTYDGFEFLRMAARPNDWGHAGSYMIFQPQLEMTLRRGVERYKSSVNVRFGEEFASLTQDASGVTVNTSMASYRVRFVIAADGGSSAVRRQLGIAMNGETSERVWIVVDAKVKKSWPERELLTFWSDPIRPAVDIPLAMGFHRWELPLGPREHKEDFGSSEAIWKLIKPMGVTEENVTDFTYAFYSHVRMASNWRVNRVLLAGDAAHLMPPWAGQGMQSGMRDSANLAWKLRAILEHGVSESILDTYQPERQPHVAKVTQSSITMGKLVEAKGGVSRTVRNRMLSVVSRTPTLRAKFAATLRVGPEISAGFLSDRITEMSPIGKMIPQPFVRSASGARVLLDDALGTEFVVLGMNVDPTTVLSREQKLGWDQFGARYEIIRTHSIPGTDSLVDVDGELKAWFDAHGSTVVVVRPDRFVAASDNSSLDVPVLAGVLTSV